MSKVKLNIELTGNQEDVLSFIGLCAKIELLSTWGASRTIPVCVDGDGSSDLKFNVIVHNAEEDKKLDLMESWKDSQGDAFYKEIDGELNAHYIGE